MRTRYVSIPFLYAPRYFARYDLSVARERGKSHEIICSTPDPSVKVVSCVQALQNIYSWSLPTKKIRIPGGSPRMEAARKQ